MLYSILIHILKYYLSYLNFEEEIQLSKIIFKGNLDSGKQ